MSMSLRVVYAGTPDFAVPALEALVRAGHDVRAVYTQPDRPAGRGRALMPSPVKARALALGLPVEQPLHFKEPSTEATLCAYAPEVMVVAASWELKRRGRCGGGGGGWSGDGGG